MQAKPFTSRSSLLVHDALLHLHYKDGFDDVFRMQKARVQEMHEGLSVFKERLP
jgi:hypothetical protein